MDRLDPGVAVAQDIDDQMEDDDMREPTKEEIMEDIRLGIREARAGKGMPARESLKALVQRIYGDADND